MLNRINWMSIATGAVLVISLLFAFLYGWYQWGNAARASQNQDEVRRQIGVVSEELRQRREGYSSTIGTMTAPAKSDEEVTFLRNLQVLMNASGVKQVQLDRARLEILPSITSATGAASGTGNANSGNTASSDPNAPQEPSISNLPLNVRANSINLVVQGSFSSIRLFLYQIQSFRYRSRAININSMQISSNDDKGSLRAALVLTRFIRPEGDDLTPIGANAPADPRGVRSSPAVRLSQPDAP